jgi:predicted esterase
MALSRLRTLTASMTGWAVAASLLATAAAAAAQDSMARGVVVDPVTCAEDPAQSYALFLPSTYSPDRGWSLLVAFHPAARGRQMAEKYRAAAERYGYIVAASNNARNGPHAISAAAAQAVGADVGRRFAIDPKRIYLTGFSGGARVALSLALANPAIAGVIASGAGYPDNTPRRQVSFAIFATAGAEDFNYLEMREMDRALSSPHYLTVVPGGHTLPPDEVAMDAIEWLEIEAMASGRRGRDDELARSIMEKRRARAASATAPSQAVYQLEAVIRDFRALFDVSADVTQLDLLKRRKDVRRALERERRLEEDEARMRDEILRLEAQLGDLERRLPALSELNARVGRLSRQAREPADTPERSLARRLLRSMAAAARERIPDKDYVALLERHATFER